MSHLQNKKKKKYECHLKRDWGAQALFHDNIVYPFIFQLGAFSYVLQPIWNSPFKFQ